VSTPPLWLPTWNTKLARADEHLDALYRETDGWGDGDPIAIDRESNADGSEHTFRLRYKVQPDTLRWAVLLGDALHNLRGALDHLIYGLAAAQTGKDPPDDYNKLAFPICSEPKFFPGACKRRLSSLSSDTQAAIERTQPYNRLNPGEWFMPLWWLSQMHDFDKHRFLHLAVLASRMDECVIDAKRGTFRALWLDPPHPDGAELLKITLTEPNPNVYVDLKVVGAVVLNVKTPDDHPPGLHHVMRHIRREVEFVCRYLTRFFGTP